MGGDPKSISGDGSDTRVSRPPPPALPQQDTWLPHFLKYLHIIKKHKDKRILKSLVWGVVHCVRVQLRAVGTRAGIHRSLV